MNEDRQGNALPIVLFAVLHLLCCGVPLLILSGVSLAFLAPHWPWIGGALAALGVIGFIWYLKRGCATCPRDEGRCWRERQREQRAARDREQTEI